MKIEDVKRTAFAMPLTSPSFPRGPYRFVDREYLVITYRTDPAAIERILPEPLKAPDPLVRYQFIRMPDSSGFGEYRASGQTIPVTYDGKPGSYAHCLFLDAEAPLAGGREIWGFPEKLAAISFKVETDTLVGTLDYGRIRLATGTMGYKYQVRDSAAMARDMAEPNFLLKIVPHVDCTPRICELVSYKFEDVTIKGAWTGPAGLELSRHALAPLSELPVLQIVSSVHFVADLTLGLGTIVHDYMKG
ncbi:MAG TPA: acetoacetate decarboxylase [Stellaceae bacterium]|nr:acetoacetate decarboxylase [Stellaceae bacterium]